MPPRFHFHLLIALLIGLVSPCLLAAPIIIDSDLKSEITIGTYAEILEDSTTQLQITDLIDGDHPWQPLNKESLNSGYSKSAFWLRVKLINRMQAEEKFFLDLGSSLVDYANIYSVTDGIVRAEFVSGDRLPFSSRPLDTRTITAPLTLRNNETTRVYIRIASYDGLHEIISPQLLTAKLFAGKLQLETLALGIYQGVLLSILLYNLFLLVSTKQKRFLLYILYIASFSFWGFIFRGYGFQYLWPNSPNLNNQILPVFVSLSYVTFALFSIEYLDIKKNAPVWLYKTNVAIVIFNLFTIVPALIGYYFYSFAISVPAGISLLIVSVSTGMLLLIQGSRSARYFMLAFGILAIGVLSFYFQLLDLVEANIITEYGIQIGSSLEAILLAFGLADQMNTLKAEKLKAEQIARAAQNTLSKKLTIQVQQRTKELEAANKKLEEMATTDELTGAYNRRRFNQLFELELSSHRRMGVPLAFCMIDVDMFKLYNDEFGHQSGDVVLQKICNAIFEKLRRSNDYLFRLGGEEFAILFSVDFPTEKAFPFLEIIRQEIENLAIPHPQSPHKVVTASFGLVILNNAMSSINSDELYAKADALLYQAKESGRNQVVHKTLE